LVLQALDTATRPLVTPDGPNYAAIGTGGTPTAEGQAGTLWGLPVFVDPSVPTNPGAGTNEDRVFVGRFSDCWLYESELRMEVLNQTYGDQLSVLTRCYGYSAFLPDRYGASVNVVSGTGLVAPTL
jgi:hypothetical protein